jgi:RNA polymerase sigma-70 factor (ECF subfamily)
MCDHFPSPRVQGHEMSGFADVRPDPALIRRARRGDMKAHEVLYRGYRVPVYTLACRMLQNTAAAEEVLQETSIEVIRNLKSIRDDGAFGGWVKRIAVNKCLGHLRSGWHRLATPVAERGEAGSVLLEPSDGGHGADRPAGEMDLEKALSLLGPVARTVVWLHDVEGYTHGEIGRLMNKTTSFSKSQLARAHGRLRELLGQDNGDDTCMPQPNSYSA